MKLKKEYKLFVAGDWIDGEETIEVTNPYDGSLVAKAHSASITQVRDAIELAESSFPEVRSFPPYKRRDALLKIAAGLQGPLHGT